MNTLRTQEEIVAHIHAIVGDDFFGFQKSDMLNYLDYDHAKPFLKDGVAREQWDTARTPYSHEAVLKEMSEYMEFAWEKANNCRGLSASRTDDHYTAWVWLMGDDAFVAKRDAIEYEHYGKERLIAVCDHYGWDWQQWDNGIRTNHG